MVKIELQGSLYYHPRVNDSEFSDLVWKRKFDNDFEFYCRFQGVWVFHSRKLNEVLVLLKRRYRFPIKNRKGWSEFQVWSNDKVGNLVENIIKEFEYPK